MKILKSFSATVLFEKNCRSTRVCVEAAVTAKVNLRGANLGGVNLRGANLGGANLRDADLKGADLGGANLGGANLRDADLKGADLRDADLRDADLRDADLRDAYLRGAYLRGAYLRGAYLRGADLRGADLKGADLPPFQIPEGRLIAWKKIQGRIVKLSIPEKAKRTASLIGRKCRAEYARCLDIEGAKEVTTRDVVYRVGKTIYPDKYDDNPAIACTNGIHFFITRQEAENW